MGRADRDASWRESIAAGRAALQRDPDDLDLVHDLAFELTEAAWTFDLDTPGLPWAAPGRPRRVHPPRRRRP